MPKKHLCLRVSLVLSLVALLCFYHFGRSVWHPWKVRLLGSRSVEQVLVSLHAKVARSFPNLDTLTDGRPIALLVFKEEEHLELWKNTPEGWAHIRDYPMTASSGALGPKLKEGDRQIPEGIYQIEGLNPNSSYHLSMKVSYPNLFDRERAQENGRSNLGGDIFIHGKNVSIGCVAIGDDAIEDVFYLVAANGYTNTTVIIAPFDMRVGSSRELEISSVSWEPFLYSEIRKELQPFHLSPSESSR